MKILCTQALEGVLPAMLPHLTGDAVVYGTTGQLVAEVEAGKGGDLLLASRPALDELANLGKVEAGSLTDIASTPVGIGIRQGAGKIDLPSVEALKRLLLAAGPIAYPEPAGGGVSGVHFAHVQEALDVIQALKTPAAKQIMEAAGLSPAA